MARNDFQSNYLAHHGILGMKWGIRRYQNKDGTLTEEGRRRAGLGEARQVREEGKLKANSVRRSTNVSAGIAKGRMTTAGITTGASAGLMAGATSGLIDELGFALMDIGLSEAAAAGIAFGFPTALGAAAVGVAAYRGGKIIADIIKTNGEKKALKVEHEYENLEKAMNNYAAENSNKKPSKSSNDGADIEQKAHAAAKKAGLDQGDNWKVYRDAQAGDKKSQEVIKKWESDKKSPVAMLTADEAKKLGYDDSTRLSSEEESEFWKAYAAQIEKEQKRKR